MSVVPKAVRRTDADRASPSGRSPCSRHASFSADFTPAGRGGSPGRRARQGTFVARGTGTVGPSQGPGIVAEFDLFAQWNL